MTTKHRRRKRRNNCVTGKVRYRDQTEALAAIHGLKESDSEVIPIRCYQCPKCNGWHLTSTDPWRGGESLKPKDSFEKYLAKRVKEKFDGWRPTGQAY